jgi:prevent-host-death family protein
MSRVKIATLKDHLSAYLRAVEAGAEVIVTDRDRPIARISPMPDAGPVVHLLGPRAPFEPVRDRERPAAAWAIASTALLLEERGDR